MSKKIELELGKYKIKLICEGKELKCTGIFSSLPPIPIHKTITMNEILGEFFKRVAKKYSKIRAPPVIKKLKKEREEEEEEEEEDIEEKKKREKREREEGRKISKLPFKQQFMKLDEYDELCIDFTNKIKKIRPFAQGTFGKVRDWDNGIVVKVESCKLFNVNLSHDIRDRSYFIQKGKEKLIILEPLIRAGITVRIYDIDICGDKCITFMDKIEGQDLYHILNKLDKSESELDSDDEESEKIISKNDGARYFLLDKTVKVIKKFHNIMKKNGYNFGHGDLHSGNIILDLNLEIKLIDFAFESKKSFSSDWDDFFNGALGDAEKFISEIKKDNDIENY
jgi:hypothetical protein